MRWLVAVLAVWVATAIAVSPATAGRPLETEDAGILDPGDLELELSADYARSRDEDFWLAKAVVSAGLLPRLEARLELPVAVRDPDAERPRGGLADALVGAKYRLLDETAAAPALLGAVVLRLPTGDRDGGLGADGVDVTALAVVGKSLGDLVLHGNVGYTFVTAARDLDVVVLAASAEYRLSPTLTLAGEALGFLPVRGDAPATGRVRAGVIYAVRPDLRLDAAVGHGLTDDSARLLVTVGVTLGF